MSRYFDRFPTRANSFPTRENGIVPTVRILMQRVPSLVSEFQVDVPRKLRRRYNVDVPHYLIDIAEPTTQVAIEVDGNGHTIAWDSVRDAILGDLGWTVLRYPINVVYEAPAQVAREIRLTIRERMETQPPGLFYRQ